MIRSPAWPQPHSGRAWRERAGRGLRVTLPLRYCGRTFYRQRNKKRHASSRLLFSYSTPTFLLLFILLLFFFRARRLSYCFSKNLQKPMENQRFHIRFDVKTDQKPPDMIFNARGHQQWVREWDDREYTLA